MTKAEAVRVLKNTVAYESDFAEAKLMAIRALLEPERKTGRWIEKEVIDNENGKVVDELQSAQCDQCGRYHTTPYMYYFKGDNFCPYCGADMRGDNE